MRLLLSILAAAVIAASLIADYKWRQWMAARRQDREQDRDRDRQQDRKFPGPPQLQ
jgi:Ni/Co efflux regulator RcnB